MDLLDLMDLMGPNVLTLAQPRPTLGALNHETTIYILGGGPGRVDMVQLVRSSGSDQRH